MRNSNSGFQVVVSCFTGHTQRGNSAATKMRREKSKTNRRGSDKQEQRYMKEREIEKHAGDPRGLLVFFSEGRLKGAALSQRAEGPSIAAVSFRLHFLTFSAGKARQWLIRRGRTPWCATVPDNHRELVPRADDVPRACPSHCFSSITRRCPWH